MRSRLRNLLRFGLKTILILTTVVAVVCGLWLREVMVQREVCKRLEEAGIEVYFNEPQGILRSLPKSLRSLGDGHYFCPVTEIDLPDKQKLVKRATPDVNLLELVCQLPDLEKLSIDSTLVESDDFHLLARCRKLASLDLGNSNLDDEAMAQMPRLPNLKTLILNNNEALTGKGIDAERYPKLEVLHCFRTAISDEWISEIGQLKTLNSLDLSDTSISDEGVKSISGLAKLKSIDLGSTGVTGAGLGVFQNLEWIDLSDSCLSNEGMKEIASLRKLKELNCTRCVFLTDQGVRELAHHPAMESFTATQCDVTDASLDTLASIHRLKRLGLQGTKVRSLKNLCGCRELNSITISSSEVRIEDALRFADRPGMMLQIDDPKAQVEHVVYRACFFGASYQTWLTDAELSNMAGIGSPNNTASLALGSVSKRQFT